MLCQLILRKVFISLWARCPCVAVHETVDVITTFLIVVVSDIHDESDELSLSFEKCHFKFSLDTSMLLLGHFLSQGIYHSMQGCQGCFQYFLDHSKCIKYFGHLRFFL